MQSESNFTLGSQHLDTTWNVLSEFSTQFLTDFSVFFCVCGCLDASAYLFVVQYCLSLSHHLQWKKNMSLKCNNSVRFCHNHSL